MKISGTIVIVKKGWQYTYDFDQEEEGKIAYGCTNGSAFYDGWIGIAEALEEIMQFIEKENEEGTE